MGNQQIKYTVKKLNEETITLTCSQDQLMENLKKIEPHQTDLIYKLQSNNCIEIVKENKIQDLIVLSLISQLKQEKCLKELKDQFDQVTKKIKLNEEQILDLQMRNGENSDSIQELNKIKSQSETQSVQQKQT